MTDSVTKEELDNLLYSNRLYKDGDEIQYILCSESPTNLYVSYIVVVNKEYKYYFKKLRSNSDYIFFESELTASLHFCSIGISPKVVYKDEKQGIIITEYIQDDKSEIKHRLDMIARNLKVFHQKAVSKDKEIYSVRKEKWIKRYLELPDKIQQDFRCFYDIFVDLSKYYDECDVVTSHNDFHQGNILANNDIYIIDFDHMGRNTKYFDLATMAISLKLNVEEEKELLGNYSENYDYEKFMVQKMVSVAHYGFTTLSLINDATDLKIEPVVDHEVFAWRCGPNERRDVASLRAAYNWLNYFHYMGY